MLVILGFNLGVDFKGGAAIEVKAKTGIAEIDGDPRNAQRSEYRRGAGPELRFAIGSVDPCRLAGRRRHGGPELGVAQVRAALEADYDIRRVEVVGPTVSAELTQAGLIAVAVALLAIGIYIWFRFEWQFAIGAIIATLHDLFLTIGMFAILQLEFSLTSIAAMLTIIGYSINDTVVVYDRIRENLRKYKKMPIPELIDLSINQTLSRTILTGVTTLLALIALYFLGGEVLAGFSFAMIFGILVGTYSSVFVAAPLLILFKLRPGQLSEEKPVVNPFAGAEVVTAKKKS